MFLDHYKPAYKTDLKLCEELKLVTPGSVMAADNVIKPGNPPYLEYVRSTVAEKRKAAESGGAEGGPDARFADRTSKQYAKRQGDEKLDGSVTGNPNLVYDSKLVNSFEPTGVPVRLICLVVHNVHKLIGSVRTVLRLRGVLEKSHEHITPEWHCFRTE